jgi:PiT family inorganic phosphate transporter
MEPVILFGIILALALNFVNGLNDASHSVATVVATRALSPLRATIATGICNAIGPFIFTTAVARTIGTTLVQPSALTPFSIVTAMLVAIIMVFVATRAGIPLSSSHALVGALLGAGIAVGGLSALIPPTVESLDLCVIYGFIGAILGALVLALIASGLQADMRLALFLGAAAGIAITIPVLMIAGVLVLSGILVIVLFIFISPVIGIVSAFLFDLFISQIFRCSRQNRMRRIFQPLHILASLFQAAGHGANDGQHAVGVITTLLLSAGLLSGFIVPFWVLAISAAAIGLGTCFGGWQVIARMAKKITKIRPYQGFCAATSGSAVLAMVTSFGIPVSSTHVISGAIIGVGATRGKKAIQWDVVRQMMTAWVITIPLGMILSFIAYHVADLFLF